MRRRFRRRTTTRVVRIPPKLAKAIAKRNGMALEEVTGKKVATRAKYGNRKVTTEHGTFDSRREASVYADRVLMQIAGVITDLERQPMYDLHGIGADGEPQVIGKFKPDMRYRDAQSGELVVVDVKSKYTRTEAYMLRKRMFEAEYGIKLTEVY